MKDTKQKVIDMYQSGKYESLSEIGRVLKIDRATVLFHVVKAGIYTKMGNKRSKEIKINDVAEQIILGSILGDGSMTSISKEDDPSYKTSRKRNSALTFAHCEKQKDYAYYKLKILEDNGIKHQHVFVKSKEYLAEHCKIKGRKINSSTQYHCSTRKSISFNKYREMFYNLKTGKKYVNRYIYKLGALGLAIWFMDDGSISGQSYVFYTDSFSDKSLHLLQKMMKHNFNIDTRLQSHGRGRKCVLAINARSNKIFEQLVEPYMCDCMKYKLKSNKNSVNLGKPQ